MESTRVSGFTRDMIARTASLQAMYAQQSNAPSGRDNWGRGGEGGEGERGRGRGERGRGGEGERGEGERGWERGEGRGGEGERGERGRGGGEGERGRRGGEGRGGERWGERGRGGEGERGWERGRGGGGGEGEIEGTIIYSKLRSVSLCTVCTVNFAGETFVRICGKTPEAGATTLGNSQSFHQRMFPSIRKLESQFNTHTHSPSLSHTQIHTHLQCPLLSGHGVESGDDQI